MNKLLILLLVLSACASHPDPLGDKIKHRKMKMGEKMTPAKEKVFAKMKKATKELRASGIEGRALDEGVKVPEFYVGNKKFSDIYKKQPVILKFYRGHWCPYCMLELQEYQKLMSEIEKAGGKLVALVPDKARHIKKTKKKYGLTFSIFRDNNNKIAKQFGLAFKMDKEVLKIYKGFGIDLVESQGNRNNELPMPGTYVIGTDGKVSYAFFNADYTKRANPNIVLEELKKAK